MGVRLKGLLAALTLLAAAAVLSDKAMAQQVTAPPADVVTIPEAFERAYYSNDRNYFQNRTIPRQLNFFLGQGSIIRNGFPDNEIARDGRAVDRVYREIFEQQVASDPLIRTPDLANPFDTSFLLLPTSPAGAFSTGTELVPEAPLPTSSFSPPPVPVAPARPVPALY
jgi:hypothetical protein